VSRPDQKTSERKILDAVRLLDSNFPPGRIKPGESPDFIVLTGRKQKTGIEIVTISNNPDISDSLTNQIADILRKKQDKYPLYQKKLLNEIWLIAAIRDIPARVIHNLGENLIFIMGDIRFNRLILYDTSSSKIFKYPAE
jgi:hypothetical protein